MLKPCVSKEDREVGVVVGRFQAPELHVAHKALLEEVSARHGKVLVFLGVSPVLGSKRDPLDFESRKQMVQSFFPDTVILPIKDVKSDAIWSQELDKRIREIFPVGKVVLYGGRDSFLKNYGGKFEVCEFEQNGSFSATNMREQARLKVKNSKDWRDGVIYGINNQYEKAVMCVDIALLKNNRTEVVLGKRNIESKFRFFGGHIDPKDDGLESAAGRELREEAGCNLEISYLRYVGSVKVDDWRYRNNCDKIITALFVAEYCFGNLKAGDDIDVLRTFRVEDFFGQSFLSESLVEEHVPLMKLLIKFLRKENCPCEDMEE